MSSSTALRWALGITVFLELRVLGLGSILNGILIVGLLISLEIYLMKSKGKKMDLPLRVPAARMREDDNTLGLM